MPRQPFPECYENLKRFIHKQLVDKLDPDKVNELTGATLRLEVRLVIERLLDMENPLLNLTEREKLINDVLNMTLGSEPKHDGH